MNEWINELMNERMKRNPCILSMCSKLYKKIKILGLDEKLTKNKLMRCTQNELFQNLKSYINHNKSLIKNIKRLILFSV